MTVFWQLSNSQQYALRGHKADTGTRKALAIQGLVEPDHLSGFQPVTLTDLGRLVMLSYEQRQNTTEKFRLGDRVISLDFTWQNNQLRFQGRDLVVTKVTDAVVTVQRNSYQVRRAPFSLAHYADVEAAGLIGLVRPDPLEVQP